MSAARRCLKSKRLVDRIAAGGKYPPIEQGVVIAGRLALGIYGAYCLIGFSGVGGWLLERRDFRLVGGAFDFAVFLLLLSGSSARTTRGFFSRRLVALPSGSPARPEICLLLVLAGAFPSDAGPARYHLHDGNLRFMGIRERRVPRSAPGGRRDSRLTFT